MEVGYDLLPLIKITIFKNTILVIFKDGKSTKITPF